MYTKGYFNNGIYKRVLQQLYIQITIQNFPLQKTLHLLYDITKINKILRV